MTTNVQHLFDINKIFSKNVFFRTGKEGGVQGRKSGNSATAAERKKQQTEQPPNRTHSDISAFDRKLESKGHVKRSTDEAKKAFNIIQRRHTTCAPNFCLHDSTSTKKQLPIQLLPTPRPPRPFITLPPSLGFPILYPGGAALLAHSCTSLYRQMIERQPSLTFFLISLSSEASPYPCYFLSSSSIVVLLRTKERQATS